MNLIRQNPRPASVPGGTDLSPNRLARGATLNAAIDQPAIAALVESQSRRAGARADRIDAGKKSVPAGSHLPLGRSRWVTGEGHRCGAVVLSAAVSRRCQVGCEIA